MGPLTEVLNVTVASQRAQVIDSVRPGLGVVLGCGVGLNLALQFAYHILLIRGFGTRSEIDAYFAALSVPQFLTTTVGSSLSVAVLPSFMRMMAAEDEDQAWGAAGATLTLATFALSLLVLLAAVFAGTIVRAVLPGFGPDQRRLTVALFRLASPVVALLSVTAIITSLAHGCRQFILASAAQIIGTAVALISVLVLKGALGVYSVPVGTLLGSLGSLVALTPVLRKIRWSFRLKEAYERSRETISKSMPVTFGMWIYKLDPVVDRFIASGLPVGSIAVMGYASRITSVVANITAGGVTVQAVPLLTEAAGLDDRVGLARSLHAVIDGLFVLLVPATLFLALFVQPFLALFLLGDNVPSSDVSRLTLAIVCYAGVMIGGIAGTPISRTYYGLGDFTTPIVVSLVGFACYSILKLLLSWQFSFYGIAIGSSIGCLSNAFVLVALLKRRVPQLSLVLAAQAFLRPTAAAVAAAIPALIARRYLGDNGLAAAFVPAIIYACGYGLFHLSFLLRTFNSRIRVNAIG